MQRFAATAEAIAATTKKSEKVRILAAYLRSLPVEDAAIAAIFFSGRPFPAYEESTLQAGGALLARLILEVSGQQESALEKAYRQTGDLGAAAYDLLSAQQALAPGTQSPVPLTLSETAQVFRAVASARGPAAKAVLLRRMLERASPLEAKYLVKIITGDLRIGLKESLVEEAIAAAYGANLAEVQRANMLLGDIGETLRLAERHALGSARMRLFHPLGFMLASPVDSAEEAFELFAHAQIEDKYDGIRAQAHCAGGEARLFSRTLDEVTSAFPELVEPLTAFDGVILDGEIVAWDFKQGHALPFAELQKRLGRKQVTAAMMRSVPVAYVVFDVLYAEGELVIDRRLRERDELLDRLFVSSEPRLTGAVRSGPVHTRDLQGELVFEPALASEAQARGGEPVAVLRAPLRRADSADELQQLFARAQARGTEGLMIKDRESSYQPGRRGRSWLKLKRELATLDVVVTSVEWGHGKRIGVLSDYTFAVRDPDGNHDASVPRTSSGDPLLNVGKAYSGLTDREIAEMTEWFLEHTVADHGWWRAVEPRIVIEVAFNAVMRSDRHNSGYALRFPRILRLRPDKSPDEADTLERVREIYERQKLPRTA